MSESPEYGSDQRPTKTTNPPRDFADLRSTGLLWLINRVVLHPRGFALGLCLDEEGHCDGWTLLGDGSEPWHFESDGEDELFAAVEKLLSKETE